MPKSLFSLVAVALLIAGCVSVTPPGTAGPSGTAGAPSFGVATPAPPATAAPATPTPTASPTDEPTSTPTTEPTQPASTPTVEPTASAEGTPAASPGTDPLARDLLFIDDFSDPASGWDTLDEPVASIGYDSGNLAFRFNETGWAYTVRNLESPHAVLRPIAQFTPDSDGLFGLMCGNTDGTFYAAVLGADGGWVFARIDLAGVTVLTRDEEADLEIQTNEPTAFGLQCTANDDGSLNLEIVIANGGPIAVHTVPDAGVSNFGVVGIYGEALDGEFSMAVSGTAVYAVEGETGQPSAGAQELQTHIPAEFQVGCAESPVPPLFTEPADYTVTCLLQTSGEGAELIEFVQFPSKEEMDIAYQERVETFGEESEGSCQTGPNETTWSIDEVQLGRVQCAPQLVGVRYDWTDDRLNILASLVDLDGDYGALYDQWLNAGPNE